MTHGGAAADLRHIDTWLFDLDNTLYPLDSGLAERMSAIITDYVARITGLPRDDARGLQKRYLADHGLTLRGLMDHHGVEPDDYHSHFHQVALDGLAPDPELRSALLRLPGRRLIFTNSDLIHTNRVVERLGLVGVFDEVFHIGSADFTPKPSAVSFERILAAHAIVPGRTAFFEDAERNLEPAARLGMTTILVGPHAAASTAPFVHHRAPALAAFLVAARIEEIA